ncbi:MAG TPA: alpha/beta hydrolase [Anaerolineales bacterium]
MSSVQTEHGYAKSGGARIYYEIAGHGTPLVMIHAGVADSRQWNNEFPYFAEQYKVLRYDMRGYGKSEPVEGEFSHMSDLVTLLDQVRLTDPLILMGCSMGGGLAMDFALAYPKRARALIMVDAGPGGLDLDLPSPPEFAEAEEAFKAGDLDRVAELETRIWFDGLSRTPGQVDQAMRQLAYDMDRHALSLEARGLGKRVPNSPTPAAERLGELNLPVLIIVGAHDTPYMHAAADYMLERIPSAQKAVIEAAAHLPNMDRPEEFRSIVEGFLGKQAAKADEAH